MTLRISFQAERKGRGRNSISFLGHKSRLEQHFFCVAAQQTSGLNDLLKDPTARKEPNRWVGPQGKWKGKCYTLRRPEEIALQLFRIIFMN